MRLSVGYATAKRIIHRNLAAKIRAGIDARKAAPQEAKPPEDLLPWCKRLFPSHFPLPFHRQHQWLAERCKRGIKERGQRIVLEGARGSAKSSILTFGDTMHDICYDLEPFIVLTAETKSQAQDYLDAIKAELETNEIIEAEYPHAFGRGRVWSKSRIRTKNGITIVAFGAGSRIRGIRIGKDRPSKIVFDDIEGDDSVFSPTKRQKRLHWLTHTILPMGSPVTNVYGAGSRLHNEGVTATLAKQPGWEHGFFTAIIQWPERLDLWDKWESILWDKAATPDGKDAKTKARAFYEANKAEMERGAEVLWPEREPLYDLMLHRASVGHAAFLSEKQNQPRDPSLCEWPDEFWGDWIWFDNWPADSELLCKVMALDPSKGKEETSRRGARTSSDFQAIAMLAVGKDGNLYFDLDLDRRTVPDMIGRFVDLIASFGPDVAVVEANQFQELLIPEMQDVALRDKVMAPIEPVVNTMRKAARILSLGPYITRRRFRLKRRSRGTTEALSQLQAFPNGDHDDAPDSMSMCVQRCARLLSQDDGQTDSPY